MSDKASFVIVSIHFRCCLVSESLDKFDFPYSKSNTNLRSALETKEREWKMNHERRPLKREKLE